MQGKSKREKVKSGVSLFKKGFLPFTLLPFTFYLASCNWKIKPTFPGNQVASALKLMCSNDYRLSIEARRQGDNLQAFFWKVGLLKPGHTEMKSEAAEALERVLLCATRISLSTDAPLRFIEVKMADVLTGSSVALWRYVPDIRDSMYTRMGTEEYINRLVVEVNAQPSAKDRMDGTIHWDVPITMAEFLAKQVVLRAKRQSPVSLQAHEDLSHPQTLVVVVENWPMIEKEGAQQKKKVTDLVENMAKTVVRGYQFQGFRNVILQDSRGLALRSWAL